MRRVGFRHRVADLRLNLARNHSIHMDETLFNQLREVSVYRLDGQAAFLRNFGK